MTDHDIDEEGMMEDHFFNGQQREYRRDRKIASTKDRSKYKKTNADQLQKRSGMYAQAKQRKEKTLVGRILSISGAEIKVAVGGDAYACIVRGLLKRDKTRAKNIVTVGDIVEFELLPDNEGLITKIHDRYSVLSRADNLSRRQEQLIASNIDQVIITASVLQPHFKPQLIDRYIIAARKGNMAPVIVINKVDLFDGSEEQVVEKELYDDYLAAFESIDIPVIPMSVVNQEGLKALKEVMKDKTSVFSGQSGVGKSSLINLVTGLKLVTRETVERTKKGAHTTTNTKLIPLDLGGWCVDTPGIKSFGVWDLKKEEVPGYFPDIQQIALACKFPNCMHIHEPSCAVQEAIIQGTLARFRFDSYQGLLDSVTGEHRRR